MTKGELVTKMATEAGLTKANAEKALLALQVVIQEALKAGEKVTIPGFGTFSVSDRAARVGKNPQTGEPLQIAASKSPKFKAGKTLKDACN